MDTWLRGADGTTQQWLRDLEAVRTRIHQMTEAELDDVIWYAHQTLHLAQLVVADGALMAVGETPVFRCGDLHTCNCVNGEGVSAAIRAARLLLRDAVSWPLEGAPEAYGERANRVSFCIGALRSAQAACARWVDLPMDTAAELERSLAENLARLRALAFWWKARVIEEPPLTQVDELAPHAAVVLERFSLLHAADAALEARLPRKDKWQSRLLGDRLLAHAQHARVVNELDAACTLWHAAREAKRPPECEMQPSKLGLRAAEARVAPTPLPFFQKGTPLPPCFARARTVAIEPKFH